LTLTIVLLVLASAALHPLWNLLIKKDSNPDSAFLSMYISISVVAGLHGLLTGSQFWLSSDQWQLILISTAGQCLYSIALVATLKRGDLSAYYPIIRASPLFIVTFNFFILGTHYDWEMLMGIALVMSGAVLLLYRRGVNIFADWRVLSCAVLALCGTGIYSLADAELMTEIDAPVLFFWVQLFTWPVLLLAFKFFGHPIPVGFGIVRLFQFPVLHAKLLICVYGSYFLILQAYALGGDVAAVTTVRQASIPLSVIIGGYFLKEGSITRRLVASVILSAGIIIVISYA